MSTTTTDLGSVLSAAIQGGYVAHLAPATYTITSPIVIHVTNSTQGPLGLDGGGATFVSQLADGQPVIQIVVDPGVDLRYLTLSNFTISGNGQEGDGISIVAPSNDSWVYNWTISGVTVENVGGYGLDVQGSVFEGTICDSWMIDNAEGGARFAHSAEGGATSALRWLGGGFEDNGGPGLMLDNGARDISVDGASFARNDGAGISAEWGITSVCSSDFVDNQGVGIWFQNFGGFNNNDFSSSGAQTIGIKGYLAGNATLIGNESTWAGSGADTTTLADIQGNGGLFMASDGETVITGANVLVSGAGGGNLAHVTIDTHGVTLPPQEAPAVTAALPDSTGTGVVESALRTAISSGTVADLSDQTTYIVTTPIVINITSSSQGAIGIDLGGAKIVSQIAHGGPMIEIIVAPGVDVANLTLSNFSILGNGSEAAGIRIVADGADRSIHVNISHVNIEHVGGIGLDVLGNVQGAVFGSWMHGNVGGGARFAGTDGGGMADDLEWIGGGFRKNGGAGLILDGGVHDMTVRGAYFVENDGPGIDAGSGITLVRNNGFENNQGAGAIVAGSASFVDNTFSTWGPQQVGIGGYLAGGTLTLIGDSNEYYGGGADTTKLANVQGAGTLGIAGGGNVVVGPEVTVTGANLVVSPPTDEDSPPASGGVPSEQADQLSPGDGDNTLDGRGGDDMIDGAAGADWLHGGAGNDVVIGGSGVDVLSGDTGDDVLSGGSAAGGYNVLNGGDGVDTASYAWTSAAVYADIGSTGGHVGGVLTDIMSGVENLRGGGGADMLVGDGGANRLEGGAGASDDLLFGRGGDDVLSGGLAGAAGYNQLWGDAGSDTASYEFATTMVYADLRVVAGWVANGGGTLVLNDVYNSIENLTGGSGADSLVGNDDANRLTGGVGADLLYGFGGDDTFVYRSAAESNLTTGYDSIADFESGIDTLDLTAFGIAPGDIAIMAAGGFTSALYANTDGVAGFDLALVVTGTIAPIQIGDILF